MRISVICLLKGPSFRAVLPNGLTSFVKATWKAFVHQSQTFVKLFPPFFCLWMWAFSVVSLMIERVGWGESQKGVEWNTPIHSVFLFCSQSASIAFKDTGSALGADRNVARRNNGHF